MTDLLTAPTDRRRDILGVYAADVRVAACSTAAVRFTDGVLIGRASPLHVFRLFGVDHRVDMTRSWEQLADALVELLGAPRVQVSLCPTCGDELPGLLAQCAKPRCLNVQTRDEKRADRWAER